MNWRSVVSQNRIGNHAKNLLHELSRLRRVDGTVSRTYIRYQDVNYAFQSTRPLFFVSHSLGGLVCEDVSLVSVFHGFILASSNVRPYQCGLRLIIIDL